jgi:GNAT superfamily N-acetyltransferase
VKAPPDLRLRDLDPLRDAAALRECFLELQAFERGIVPALASPDEAVDPYLEMMLARCDESGGKVIGAEVEGRVVGFASIWGRLPPQTPDDDPRLHAWVSDLVVLASHRGRGIGRRLLEAAEAFARSLGVGYLGISVLAENAVARELYVASGFRPHQLVLRKELDAGPPR